MIIRKRYNVEQLAEQLQTEIENSKKYNRVVKLDILTASDILDVLEMLASWENKSSKSNDVMKVELEDNRNCFGYCVEDDYICTHCADYEKCRKEACKNSCDAAVLNRTQTNETKLHNKKDANGNILRSMNCHSKVLNGTQTNDRIPGCYGCYYDKGLYCPDCKSRESCVKETINRENVEEDDDFI